MTETLPSAGANLLFLREEQVRQTLELLFFAQRDFSAAADLALEGCGLGRAHQRALFFIGRNPGVTVSKLLTVLGITKQSLARVLATLLEAGYVEQASGASDRRQRLLRLTPAGEALERRLYEICRERLSGAYRVAGGSTVDGFRRVLLGMIGPDARRYIERRDRRDSAVTA